MKKILLIYNDPKDRKSSKTWIIFEVLKDAISKHFPGLEVDILDLYNPSTNLPVIDAHFFNEVMIKKYSPQESRTVTDLRTQKSTLAKSFADADNVFIVSPFWTGLFPSKLKDWIDLLPENGVTLKAEGDKLTGLFRGRVYFIQTMGGLALHNSENFGEQLLKSNMEFYGAKKFRSQVIENVESVPLPRFKELAEKVATDVLEEVVKNCK